MSGKEITVYCYKEQQQSRDNHQMQNCWIWQTPQVPPLPGWRSSAERVGWRTKGKKVSVLPPAPADLLCSSPQLEHWLAFSRSRARSPHKEFAFLVAGDNRSRQGETRWPGWGSSSLLSWSRGPSNSNPRTAVSPSEKKTTKREPKK